MSSTALPLLAQLWNPQEGSVLARRCLSTSSALEVLPGSRINNTRDPPHQTAMLLSPTRDGCPSHARAAPER